MTKKYGINDGYKGSYQYNRGRRNRQEGMEEETWTDCCKD